MKRWQSDLIAIAAGLLVLALLLYVPATIMLVTRLSRPWCDPDVVGLEHSDCKKTMSDLD